MSVSTAPNSDLLFEEKSGQDHSIELTDRHLANIIKQCRDLPGYDLFEYVDAEGNIGRVDSSDVNRYIRDLAGQDFTAKDFRTWAGTRLAARELYAAGPPESGSMAKRTVVNAVREVAKRLGNRPATCRKYYIHPAILDAYADSSLFDRMKQGEEQDAGLAGLGLRPEEYAAIAIIATHQGTGPRAAARKSRAA